MSGIGLFRLAQLKAQQALLEEFRRERATVPQAAVRVAEGSAAFEYFHQQNVIREAAEGLYYLDEGALRSLEKRERERTRRELMLVAYAIGAMVVLTLVMLSLTELAANR